MSLFDIDLGQLETVTATTKRIHTELETLNGSLKTKFTSIATSWQARSEGNFATLTGKFNDLATQLDDLLGDAARRLDIVHGNYVKVESVNTTSLTTQ
jgi:ABC-type transporter Mla subunit MlaD